MTLKPLLISVFSILGLSVLETFKFLQPFLISIIQLLIGILSIIYYVYKIRKIKREK